MRQHQRKKLLLLLKKHLLLKRYLQRKRLLLKSLQLKKELLLKTLLLKKHLQRKPLSTPQSKNLLQKKRPPRRRPKKRQLHRMMEKKCHQRSQIAPSTKLSQLQQVLRQSRPLLPQRTERGGEDARAETICRRTLSMGTRLGSSDTKMKAGCSTVPLPGK
jgi:hypothetical protein